MRASGNGDKRVCVANLLAIVRGEVPYDRIRGLGSTAIDSPANIGEAELRQDAEWLLETYEPRAEVQSIQVTRDDAEGGDFKVTANIA